jgi:hypothetical protein
MVRGLDGIFIVVPSVALCGFEGPPGRRGLARFRWSWRGGNTSSHSEQSS